MENDAISRSAVLNELIGAKAGLSMIQTDYEAIIDEMLDIFANVINRQPAIDAVPVVHARWIYKVAYVSHAHVTNIIYCTACQRGFHRLDGVNFTFCPNCGARMDGDAE